MQPFHARVMLDLEDPMQAEAFHSMLSGWGYEVVAMIESADLIIADVKNLPLPERVQKHQATLLLLHERDDLRHHDAPNFHVDLMMSSSSEPFFVLSALRILTENRQIAKELETEKRLSQVGKITTGLLHALKGPIHNVVMSIDRLGSYLNGNDAPQRWVSILSRNADFLRESIDHLLQGFHDKKQQIPINVIDAVRAAIAYSIEHSATEHQITVQKQFPREPVMVLSRPGYLVHLMVQLLNNAREAIGDTPGTIALDITMEPPDLVRIDVTDSGPGIPPEIKHRLGEMFVTTKPNGTGLGLATILWAVRECQGQIEASSPPTGGSRFTLRFPVAKPSEANTTQVAPRE
jgi:signal transduction histidine kinase